MYEFLQSSHGDTGDCNGDGDSRGEIEDTPDDGGNAKLGFNGTLDTLKRWCTVWVAATSDEVHSTQGLLEAQGDSRRLGNKGERVWRKAQSLLK